MNAILAGRVEHLPRPPAPIETLYATAYWLMQQDRLGDAICVLKIMMLRAPQDERGWLAGGECNERIGHLNVALELYGVGAVIGPSCRCRLARAQLFGRMGLADKAAEEMEHATALGEDDDELRALVQQVADTLQ